MVRILYYPTETDWYYSSITAVGNKAPDEYCKNGKSSEIEELLSRIEHGIIS